MAGKGTDRKGKSKEVKSALYDLNYTLTTFTLPDSLPCSEVQFPIVLKKNNKANWNEITKNREKKLKEVEDYCENKKHPVPKSPFLKTEYEYIKNTIFSYLLPALEGTLKKAEIWDALKHQKCFFNGIDQIVELLWNNNPRYPARKMDNLHIFNMPWVREHLRRKYSHQISSPRPCYPKSWLWPEEYAATLIQKSVRQYFVQRDENVQEMRNFWKKLVIEKSHPEMGSNPFLAKKFASEHALHK